MAKPLTGPGRKCTQDRSQTSAQDEAIFEHRRRKKILKSKGSEMLCKHFPWHFSSEKSILGKCSDTGAKLMTICILMHSNVVTRVITIKWIHESSQRLWILYCRYLGEVLGNSFFEVSS